MRRQRSRRWAWPLAAALFVATAVVAVTKVAGPSHKVGPSGSAPAARRAVGVATFPPVDPADLAEPGPTPDGLARVDRLVGRLSAGDAVAADRAALAVERLPPADLPALEAADARPDLPPAAVDRLGRIMPRIRQRATLARHRLAGGPAQAAFYERQALADYAAGGHTDPRWDAAAESFLHLANVRYAVRRPAALTADRAEARRQLTLALGAGCDDPTVLACGGLLAGDVAGSVPSADDLFARADRAGGGGPLFRLITDGRLLRPAADFDQPTRARTWTATMQRLDDMGSQFRRLLALPGVPPGVVLASATNLLDRQVGTHAWFYANVVPFMTPLEAALPDNPGMLAIKGKFYSGYAWEARGTGYAASVTPQGAKDFAARTAVARAALERSWQLDPDDLLAPRMMLAVVRSVGGGRGEYELWFARAMAADPDSADACGEKLLYLEPKWGGTPEQMLRFGHHCLDDGNWRTEIPTVLALAHSELAKQYPAGPAAYWLRPGVWDDVRAVYAGYLERGENPTGNRNSLARYAVLCHQWRAADEQFKRLGDAAIPALFGNGTPAALDDARATAARLADRPEEQGR